VRCQGRRERGGARAVWRLGQAVGKATASVREPSKGGGAGGTEGGASEETSGETTKSQRYWLTICQLARLMEDCTILFLLQNKE
jgi:hypothetical protein